MSQSLFVCVLLFFVFVVGVSGQTPIPTRPDGYPVGMATAPVVLEAFYDLLCPDSKASWPAIQQVISNYGMNLYFIFHTFPLPYHTFSFIANQGMHVIANITNNNQKVIYQYASLIFDQQAMYYNAPTMNSSTTEVVNSLASLVSSQLKVIKAEDFIAGIADVSINYQTRVSWKYGCSRGQVTGTPTFLINGVFIDASPQWTLADWQQMIDPLLLANGININQQTSTNSIKSQQNHLSNQRHSKLFVSSPYTNSSCPDGESVCNYAPDKMECCLAGENCIPNVGCRCVNKAAGCN